MLNGYTLGKQKLSNEKEVEIAKYHRHAEHTAEKIIDYCVEMGITVMEFKLLRKILPAAIEKRIDLIESQMTLF